MNTSETSPIKVHLLRWHQRKRTILDSEEEETLSQWPVEVHEQHREMNPRHQDGADIPCASSTPDCYHSGSNPVDSDDGVMSAEPGMIIEMKGQCNDSPWDSEVDGQESETSTPGFKRGRHGNPEVSVDSQQKSNCVGTPDDRHVVQIIKEEGMNFTLPGWLQRHSKKPSLLLLADSHVKFWPKNDVVCQVEHHPSWPLNRWTQAIRQGHIRIECTTVVIYLEKIRRWEEVPPMKNLLQTLCKAIQSHGSNPRMFIANHLPGPNGSPLRSPIPRSNFTLQQAIGSTSRALGRVHELSLYEHFISRKGKLLQPVGDYFLETGVLTFHGCLVFRECIMGESGIKSYWFTERNWVSWSSLVCIRRLCVIDEAWQVTVVCSQGLEWRILWLTFINQWDK